VANFHGGWSRPLLSAVLCFIFCIVSQARAGIISTPADVAAILGATAQTENFTKFTVLGITDSLDSKVLDSTTVDYGQGPGLVNPGLTFTVTNPAAALSGLQWDGPGANGNATQQLGFNLAPPGAASVSFSQSTPAFGINLVGLSAVNANPRATVTLIIYSATSAFLDFQQISLDGTTPVFFGYASPGGIGGFTFATANVDNATQGYIATNDLLYGSFLPEPGGWGFLLVLSAGVLMRRRRVMG
jgi:hypothetical protein